MVSYGLLPEAVEFPTRVLDPQRDEDPMTTHTTSPSCSTPRGWLLSA